MNTILGIYVIAIAIGLILLYLRRPVSYIRGRERVWKTYDNGWLFMCLGFLIMLFLLTILAALHIRLGWFS